MLKNEFIHLHFYSGQSQGESRVNKSNTGLTTREPGGNLHKHGDNIQHATDRDQSYVVHYVKDKCALMNEKLKAQFEKNKKTKNPHNISLYFMHN